MHIGDFDYVLPPSHIAHRPAMPRESAKLLVVKPDALTDQTVADLPSHFNAGDLIVFNDTRVIPARLYGVRGAMKCEVMLHRLVKSGVWEAFARPLKRLRVGEVISFAEGFTATITDKDSVAGTLFLSFNREGEGLRQALSLHGHMPLPPYIERADDAQDSHDYQTIFAAKDGAVAAPTASLHLTPDLLAKLSAKGVQHCFVTLHVGAGTFQPVRVDNIDEHIMHAEYAEVSAETAALINETKAKGGRIIAVGTTVCRTLESAADNATGQVQPFAGETRIFIKPSYRFKCIDVLMTNFHLPKSTLLMLVAAFAGHNRMKAAYQHAIEQNYRFYSYGDASLLFPEVQKGV